MDDTFPKVEKFVETSQTRLFIWELEIPSHFCVVLCQIARIFHVRNIFSVGLFDE